MTKARFIAQLLSKRFMAEGRITASKPIGSLQDGLQLASAKNKASAWNETEAFSPLSVMSIGVREGKQDQEDGQKSAPEVVIFATGRPTARLLKALPREIDGISIVVARSTGIGINPDQALGDTTDPKLYQYNGRIACGSSCATATGAPGTIGALVKKRGKDDLYILSCNHVLAACNQIPLQMPIISPAPNDAKPSGPLPVSIARLSNVIPLLFGDPTNSSPCEEDVALGKVLDPDLLTSWQGDASGFDTPIKVVEPEDRMRVKKIGRSSEMTTGTIYAMVYDPTLIQCHQPSVDFKASAWFQNFAHIIADKSPFALPGDSGSLVVTEDGTAAVGILFSASASGDYGQIIPMSRILKVLDVTLVSGHGT